MSDFAPIYGVHQESGAEMILNDQGYFEPATEWDAIKFRWWRIGREVDSGGWNNDEWRAWSNQ